MNGRVNESKWFSENCESLENIRKHRKEEEEEEKDKNSNKNDDAVHCKQFLVVCPIEPKKS